MSLTYHVFKGKVLYNSIHYFKVNKNYIESEGGENMENKDELVFLEPENIPQLMRGSKGRKWKELFNKIPKGKVLKMEEKNFGSAPNIRSQVNKYNGEKELLKVTQRTENNETVVYVQRL